LLAGFWAGRPTRGTHQSQTTMQTGRAAALERERS
jgi:hypothetical protein